MKQNKTKEILVKRLETKKEHSGTQSISSTFLLPVHSGNAVGAIVSSFSGDIGSLDEDVIVGNGTCQFQILLLMSPPGI